MASWNLGIPLCLLTYLLTLLTLLAYLLIYPFENDAGEIVDP